MPASKPHQSLRRHQWANNPRAGDPSLRIPSPKLLPLYQVLVHRAKDRQHGSLTHSQYRILESEFLKARYPIGSPLIGWYYENRDMLQRALLDEGVSVRPEPIPRLHRFSLVNTGMKRLSELEKKIHNSRFTI